jgi:predicted metal-dependent hydrolase
VRAFGSATRLLGVAGIRISRRLLDAEPVSDRRAQLAAFLKFMLMSPGYGRKVTTHSLRFLMPGFRPWRNLRDPQRVHRALASI